MSDKPPKSGTPGTAWNDPKVPGLRLRFMETKAAWYLYYRTKEGRQRNMKLADESVYTLTEARTVARGYLQEVSKGGDPAGKRAALEARKTVKDLADDHYEKHALIRNKPSWSSNVKTIYTKHIRPYFGDDKALLDITEAEVNDLHWKLRKTPYRANRTLDVLRKGFKLAAKWGWVPRGHNPVFFERYKETKRNRKPTAEEAARLLLAIDAMRKTDPHFIGLVELLLFTGARLDEILSAKWSDLKNSGLHLKDSKTGEKMIPLSSLAWDVLHDIPKVKGNPYIIVGRRKGRHLVNVTKPWARLMEKAHISDRLVRHDLRRFFASAGLSKGVGLSQIGEVLGHMDARTTKRYAELLTDTAQEVAEASAKAVHDIMTGSGKVVGIHTKRE